MGYEGRTASSTVPDEALPRLRAAGGRVKPGSKPKTAIEDQLPRRRAAKEAEAAAPGDGQATEGPADGGTQVDQLEALPVEEVPSEPEPPAAAAEEAPGRAAIRVPK